MDSEFSREGESSGVSLNRDEKMLAKEEEGLVRKSI
jgi:hypothetical protein